MNGYLIVFISFIFIYLGLTLGIAIRFIEEKKYYLVILAVFVPSFVFLINIKCLYDLLFKSKKKIKNRLKNIYSIIYIMIRYYNVTIDFNVQIFVDSQLNEKIKNRIKRTSKTNDIYTTKTFRNILNQNENFMINGLKVKVV